MLTVVENALKMFVNQRTDISIPPSAYACAYIILFPLGVAESENVMFNQDLNSYVHILRLWVVHNTAKLYKLQLSYMNT